MKNKNAMFIGGAIALFIVLVWVFWALFSVQLAHWFVGTIFIPAQAGPWGDSFGGFNALFGALGFAAIVATLLLQMKAIERQEKDQHRQQFDVTFFNLIGLLRGVRDEVRFKFSADYRETNASLRDDIFEGRDGLTAAARELNYWLAKDTEEHGKVMPRSRYSQIYRTRVHKRYENSLSPYFRMIYTIFDWIRSDPVLSDSEKVRYANIVRSQFNSRELQLIGANALTDVAKDMDTIVEEFRLLKYLPAGSVRRRFRDYYSAQTFQGREEDASAKNAKPRRAIPKRFLKTVPRKNRSDGSI